MTTPTYSLELNLFTGTEVKTETFNNVTDDGIHPDRPDLNYIRINSGECILFPRERLFSLRYSKEYADYITYWKNVHNQGENNG